MPEHHKPDKQSETSHPQGKHTDRKMKITFLYVGRTTDKHLDAMISDYVERIRHYMPFEVEVIPELKNAKALNDAQQKDKEGEMILKKIQENDYVVLLDEAGRELRSLEFAGYIEKKQHSVPRRLVFVVGGPYGFSQAVYARSQDKISLSRMTFSHQMVRLFFTEQVYRALTILRGEPYHHE